MHSCKSKTLNSTADDGCQTENTSLFNAIAESKNFLERQLQERRRKYELAQAEISALRSENAMLTMQHSDFARSTSSLHEALLAAAVELSTVRESLRDDLQSVRESSWQAVSGQEQLLSAIRHDLNQLSSGLFRRHCATEPENEVKQFSVITIINYTKIIQNLL